MLTVPSQQAQESWHTQILRARIPGMWKTNLNFAFGASIPTGSSRWMGSFFLTSSFSMAPPQVPKGMIDKALWYVKHKDTHIRLEEDGDEGQTKYHFLTQSNPLKAKQMSQQLLGWYQNTLEGKKPYPLCSDQKLFDVCFSFHVVVEEEEDWPFPICQLNPFKFNCIVPNP